MRALVTGATGFIGRRLVRRLVECFGAAQVTCMVTAPASPLEDDTLDNHHALGVRLIKGDLLESPPADERPPRVDTVFHLAGNVDTNASERALRVNDLGTERLLDWIAPVSNGVRVMYASSVAVHDRAARPSGPITEQSPCVPRTGYGRTKLRGERILQQRAARDAFSWTILRLPTVYGPGQKPGGLFDQLITRAIRGDLLGRIEWPGRTSVIHVDDVVDAMIDMASRPEACNDVYCLASDETDLTVGELARRIHAVLDKSMQPVDIPRPLLRVAQSLVWSRTAQVAMPPFARLHFWRLSLILTDGFWFDASKFRTMYSKPLRSVESGLAGLIEGYGRTTSKM